jgi:hypothetical protein
MRLQATLLITFAASAWPQSQFSAHPVSWADEMLPGGREVRWLEAPPVPRPALVPPDVEALVVRMAKENTDWATDCPIER